MSRTSLLDIFLGLFIEASFAALLIDRDRDRDRRRWLHALENGYDPETGRLPRIVPWWLLAAARFVRSGRRSNW